MTDPIEASPSGVVDRDAVPQTRGRTKKAYVAPTLVRWGAVEDLTRFPGVGGGDETGGDTASGGGG